MVIFELFGAQYNNEQEIIDAGVRVIYNYCLVVNSRWRDIEHLMIEDAYCGYRYALDVIKGRYEPELETLYLMRHSDSYYVGWYDRILIKNITHNPT